MPVLVFDVAMFDGYYYSFANASDVICWWDGTVYFILWSFFCGWEEHSVGKCLKWLVRFSKVGCNFSHICPRKTGNISFCSI